MRTETSFSKSLRRFILASFSMTLLLTTFVITVCSITLNRKNLTDLGQKQLELIRLNISNTVSKIENTSLGLMFNSTIQSVLLDPELLENYEEHNLITYVFSDYRNFSDPGNVVLFDREGRLLTSSEGYSPYASLMAMSFFQDIEESQGAPVWIGPHIDSYDYRSSTSPVVSLSQKIRRLDLESPSNSGPVIGYILINIGTNDFRKLLEEGNWFSNGRLSLEMADGTVITDWGKEDMTFAKDLSSRFTSGWRLRGYIPGSEIFSISLWILAAFVVELILVYIFSRIADSLSRNITEPLEHLRAAMSTDTLDSPHKDFPDSGFTEIDTIQRSYCQMLIRLSEVSDELSGKIVREKELEVASVKAELSALQHQINPHFLYNTLDSISWMADAEGNDDVVAMITHLADFLRFHTKAAGMVPLSEEIKNAEDYVYIQKIRYGERFSYSTETDPSILGTLVIPLIIQPLVENAIIHGAEPSTENGILVKTEVREDNGFINIIVSDNGKGMDDAQLEAIRSGISQGKSVGLSNVAKRLRLTYGETAKLSIESAIDYGTTVTLHFPHKP